MKQSFSLEIPLAVGWVLVRLHRYGAWSWLRAAWVDASRLGRPGPLNVAAGAATGALVPMVSQLTSATRPNWTGTLLSLSTVASASGALVILLIVSGLLCLVWLRRAGVSKNGGNAAATAAAVGYLGAVALGLTAHFDMYDSGWSTRLFWGACAATIVAGLALGRLRTGDLGVVAVAWMTVLSWGMPWPLLSSGGLLLVIAQARWHDPPVTSSGEGVLEASSGRSGSWLRSSGCSSLESGSTMRSSTAWSTATSLPTMLRANAIEAA